MADKKPGLLKRIFSFGFGKKNKQAVEEEVPAIEEQIVEEAAAEPSAEALAADAEAIKAKEQAAHDKAEKAEAARLEKEAAKAKAATEQEAAKAEAAAQKEAAKAQAAKEKAEAKKQAEAEKEEKARLKKEAEALAAKKADAAKSAKEKAANEKARKEKKAAEDAKRKEEEEAAKVAALEQEEAERQAAEEAAKIEEEQRAAEETRLAEQAELERVEAEAAEAQRLEELAEAEALAAQEAEAISESDPDLEEVFDDDEEDEPLEELEDEDDEDFDGSDDPDLEEISSAPVEPSSGEQTVTLTERKKPKEPEPEPEEEEVQEEERKVGWLKRLTKGLSRSSNALTENITKVFSDKKLDDDTLQELEDILIQADLGVETAMKITDALSAQKFGKTVTDEEVREIMAEEIEKILAPVAVDLDLDLEHQPHVILMIGVNGSGKTTTIGKLSQKLYDAGFSTSLIAGDTFRAAAIEQLTIWGDRTQSPVLSRPLGADSAGLAFDAWEIARDERRDVMLMDTAGRLQNRTELMAELEKIVRVLKKQDPSAPHTVLLTLDATTGQNALNQVEIFQEVAGVNGLVMTKLDGTARGGILVAIAAKYKLPVYFVGVGEQVEDLEPFEARDFARSIAGLPREE